LELLLASCLCLLGDLLPLRGLLRCDALHDGLALLATTVDGLTALRGSLLCALRGFATHGGMTSLGGRGTLLAGPGLRLCFFRLLLTAVLLVVTPRVLLRAGCCHGAQGQGGADHDGQDEAVGDGDGDRDARAGFGRASVQRLPLGLVLDSDSVRDAVDVVEVGDHLEGIVHGGVAPAEAPETGDVPRRRRGGPDGHLRREVAESANPRFEVLVAIVVGSVFGELLRGALGTEVVGVRPNSLVAVVRARDDHREELTLRA
jgi:hypothetical protein